MLNIINKLAVQNKNSTSLLNYQIMTSQQTSTSSDSIYWNITWVVYHSTFEFLVFFNFWKEFNTPKTYIFETGSYSQLRVTYSNFWTKCSPTQVKNSPQHRCHFGVQKIPFLVTNLGEFWNSIVSMKINFIIERWK